jgi:asparagine synthase (glutamine-hydrolysing)
MCGMAGSVPGIDPALLRRMTRRLAHRGPDGEGFFSRPEVSLGHRRLAVIDLAAGQQPMSTPDGRFTIVFNGEIYNFAELRAWLERQGESFRTRSDTEVLLRLVAREGFDALARLRGMFAFAVWDAVRRRLLCARDRLGVKPFYFRESAGRLLFASEIKALLAHPEVPRRLDPRGVDDFLTFLYVPAPRTIFEGICELPPAHWLLWEDGFLETGCYWDARPEPAAAGPAQISEEASLAGVRERLAEAVRLRRVSDVPLGAFLSGGVDSSSIVALLSQAGSARVRTFSLGFRAGEEHYTELGFARKVSERFSTEHRELEIHPACAELLPRVVAHFDEPFGNPTALLIYQLSELTRRHVTVALAGDAGDEVFLGYPRYLGLRLRRWLDWLPRPLRAALAAAGRVIPESSNGFHARRRAREFLAAAALDWRRAYVEWVSYFTPAMRASLYAPGFRRAVGDYDSSQTVTRWFDCARGASPLDQASYADLHTFLPFNLLEYGDRMSMAHALEVRLPFTDHRLVEFAMRLPAGMKLAGGRGKYLLKAAMRDLLPAEILERRKIGLNPPLGMWLERELAPLVARALSPEAVRRRGWFDPRGVARLLSEFRAGRRDFSLHIWGLLVLEEWCRLYLDAANPPGVEAASEPAGASAPAVASAP